MKDFTNLWNMATKTIVTMEFLLDEGDIEYLEKLPTLNKETRDSFRIYVNGTVYKLHNIPNSFQIFPRKKQLIKLELEPCDGKV
jgi:hypothetical protein